MTVRTQEWVACSEIDALIGEACSKLSVIQEQAKALKAENYRSSPAALLSEVIGKTFILDDLIARLKIVSDCSEYGTLAIKARPE